MSFECERRGASEVVALGPEDPDWTGFNRIRQAIGSTRTRHVLGSIYDLDPRVLGYFDVVLCCQIIYHLRYPLLGIDNLRRVCQGDLYLETQVCDSKVLSRGPGGLKWVGLEAAAPDLAGTPLWQFYRLGELNQDHSNWFNPNTAAVIQALESAGFDTQLVRLSDQRASFHGTVKEGLPEYLAIACAESVFYDVISSPLFRMEKPKPSAVARWSLESRRRIEDFPVTGVGPDLAEILARQEPIEDPAPMPAAPAVVEPPPPAPTVAGRVKRLGKKVLRKLFRRSA
jgi:hypothetical protein